MGPSGFEHPFGDAEREVAETDEVPPPIVQAMRELGLFGLAIPEAYGGLGLTMEEEVRLMFELCRTSPAFRSVIGSTVGIGSQGIVMDGTDEQKARWLPPMARGELVATFALTEPEAGSDAASLRTSARRDGEHYVINGTKRFITNAPSAGVFTLMARTDPARPTQPASRTIQATNARATLQGTEFIDAPRTTVGVRRVRTISVPV